MGELLTNKHLILAVFIVFAAACGDSDGDDDPVVRVDAGIGVSDFVGQWNSTSHVFTNNADGAETYDVLAEGGQSRMTVLSGGGTRTFWTIATVEDEWDAALTVDGSTVTIAPVETTRPVRTYEFTLVGSALTLTNADDEFDFTLGGGAAVPATLELAMTKQ